MVNIGFAAHFVLDNQAAAYSDHTKSIMRIQWARSAKEVNRYNNSLKKGVTLNPDSLQALAQMGKVKIEIPKKAVYFRVFVWSKGKSNPAFLTNWVDVVANKTYTLDSRHLVPFVLMLGMGC